MVTVGQGPTAAAAGCMARLPMSNPGVWPIAAAALAVVPYAPRGVAMTLTPRVQWREPRPSGLPAPVWLTMAWILLGGCVAGAAPIKDRPGTDASPAFKALKKEAQAAARTGSAHLRERLLARLAAYDTAEAIDLVIRVGLSTREAAVRTAAREALATHRDDEAFATRLVDALVRELRTNDVEAAADLAAVLLAAPPGLAPGPLETWLDGESAGAAGGPRLCWAVATAAAARGGVEDVAVLEGLARLELFATDFPFRRGVVRALIAIHRVEAVAALVEILRSLRGEARADVVAYLAHVSGVNLGTDAKAWRTWLDDHRDGIVMPEARPDYPPPTSPLVAADAHADPAYYGIPLYADRVVFLIDTSGSMEENGRLDTAKRELESALHTLREDAAFTIVAYADGAVAWENRLLTADDETKRRAADFVRGLRPRGQTATGDALALAFSFDTEAVYLLSDGRPTTGRVSDPAQIVRMVAEANKSRRVSLHTIGIAPDPGLAEFLALLARANFGQFRRVDD